MTNEEDEQKVEVNIPIVMNRDLNTKINYLSTHFEKEIAGWLIGEVKTGYIYLEDILIPTQEVTGGSVDIEPSAGPELLKEFKEKCKKILGHWHSHCPNGSCHWSCTDEEKISQLMEPRKFFIFIVSAGGKHLVRLESKKPFRVSVDNLPYQVCNPNFDKIKLKLDKEIEKKVTEKNYTPQDKSVTFYPLKKQDGQRDLDDLPLKDGRDFELEIADNVIAEYKDKTLTIKGLDAYTASTLMSTYPNVDSNSYGEFYNKDVEFRIKRKKARKMLPVIQDIIDEVRMQGMDAHPFVQ